MKTTKYVIAWGVLLVMFITAVIFILSGGKEIYRWYHPVGIDDDNQNYIKNHSYIAGNVTQLSGYRYREEQDYYQIYVDNDNGSRDCVVRIEGLNDIIAVVRVDRYDRKQFLNCFDEHNLIGKYNFKAQYVKMKKGMENLSEHYDYVRDAANINTGDCELRTDYYLRIVNDNRPLGIWKIYMAATFVIIGVPYFIVLRKKSIDNYAEFECDIDEYCRRKVAEKECITKSYRYDYEIQSELEKEKSNKAMNEKKYNRYKKIFKTGIIVWIVLALLYAVIIIPSYHSINEVDMMFVDRLVLIAFVVGLYKTVKGGVWLVMNQDNRLAMWLASQTGYAPVKVQLLISNILIPRYEARLTAIHEAEDSGIHESVPPVL